MHFTEPARTASGGDLGSSSHALAQSPQNEPKTCQIGTIIAAVAAIAMAIAIADAVALIVAIATTVALAALIVIS